MRYKKFSRLVILIIGLNVFLACEEVENKEKSEGKEKKQLVISMQSSPVNTSIRGIEVLDQNTIWLSGAKGTILRTLNGGETWEQLSPPDKDSLDFRSIAAFSEKEALVASAGFPARIYHTEDAGEQWTLVYENMDSAAFINSLAFRSRNEGIAFGDVLEGRHLLLRTENGGKSWTRIDTQYIPKPLEIEHGFAASGTCIAINKKGEFFIGLGGEQCRIFKSSDGREWEVYQTKMMSGLPTRGIYSIAYGNELLMAVGGDYTRADSAHFPTYSNESGTDWKLAGGKVKGYRSIVTYAEKAKAWVSGGTSGIDFTFDNGMHWITGDKISVNTMAFDDQSGRGWLANQKGEVYMLEFQ